MRSIRAAVAGLVLAGAVLVGAGPAEASQCVIPGSPPSVYAVNAGATDQACFKEFKDYVDPASFWENVYLQETVDHGTDTGCVRLYVRIVGWTSWRHVLEHCDSYNWWYVATYSHWAPIPAGVYAKIDAKVEFRTGNTVTATRTYYDVATIAF